MNSFSNKFIFEVNDSKVFWDKTKLLNNVQAKCQSFQSINNLKANQILKTGWYLY
jgi:hypothetical protein